MEQSTEDDLIRGILMDPRLEIEPDTLPVSAIPLLLQYTRLWHKWNAKISLTSERTPDLFIKNHLFVSLQFLKALGTARGLVDIGSGAGLPGIPLKIMKPDLPVVLVECRRKRASFLMTAVRELGLKQMEVADTKVESLGPLKFPADTAVFRAVADTQTCLAWAKHALPSGGRVVLLRTPKEQEEDSRNAPLYKEAKNFPLEDFYGNPLTLIAYPV